MHLTRLSYAGKKGGYAHIMANFGENRGLIRKREREVFSGGPFPEPALPANDGTGSIRLKAERYHSRQVIAEQEKKKYRGKPTEQKRMS